MSREELEERLRAAKQKEADAVAKSARMEEERALEREVEAAERSANNAQALASAEESLPRFASFETDYGVIILKPASQPAWRRFSNKGVANDQLVEKEMNRLVRPCLHYPSNEVLDMWLSESPAILEACANKIADLAKGKTKEVEGKS